MKKMQWLPLFVSLLLTIGSFFGVRLAASGSFGGSDLPGVAAEAGVLYAIRAGEQKMYPNCQSLGSNCSYTNVCGPDSDGTGCANSDACETCTGGLNAACNGAQTTTKCVTDTTTCCKLSSTCQLTSSGCLCKDSGNYINIDNQSFCSGS